MSISSQLPPIALAQASASLRALAQAAGQTVEARVLTQLANGTTQVQIGRQVLSLALPEAHPAGTTLTLSVQQSEGQLRLALVAVRPPGAPAIAAPQAHAASVPAASVQLSPAALSRSGVAQPAAIANAGSSASPGMPSVSASVGVTPLPPSSTPAPRPAPGYGMSSPPAPTTPSTVAAAPILQGTTTPPGAIPGVSQPPAGTAPTPQPVTTGESASPWPTGPVNTTTVSGPSQIAASRPQPSQTGAVPVSPGSPPIAAPGGQTANVVRPSVVVTPQPAGPSPVRADIPYAVAASASPTAPLSGVTGSAATALPPVAQMAASSMVGQHAPPSGSPGGQPAPVQPAPTTPQPAQVSSPQAALAQMVQQSLPRQDSILGLARTLTAIAGKVVLPEPVAKAAQQVLAARVNLDGAKLTGAALKSAIQQSGIFQEALLASGQTASGDVKTALLGLRQSLATWLGNQAPVAQVSSVAPPLRGQIPRARAGEGVAPDLPDDPAEMGKVLLDRSEAALSRMRLHQNASLPDPSGQRQEAQWSMDLPVIVAGQQQVLHLQIQRDGGQETERGEERSWQVRFAINLAERGEVGAQISLRAKNVGVLLWADQEATAQALAVAVDGLREEMADAGLLPGAVVVRAGPPAAQPPQPVAAAGHVVDATR